MTVDSTQVSLEFADPLGVDAMRLLGEMRIEALRRYADTIDSLAPLPTNDPLVPRSTFLIALLNGQPVGCAALRPLDTKVAEVRGMYVVPAARRSGIGRRLLSELERKAAEFSYQVLRLETGNRQPEAIALYETHGFRRIEPYGCHANDPLSICFEKKVAGGEDGAG